MKIIQQNDCNTGEVLEDIGEDLGICYYCFGVKDVFEDGICIDCCIEGSQSRISGFLKKCGTKENLISRLAEDLEKDQARRFYNDLNACDDLEIARDCYARGYTRTKIPEECTGTTELYLARLLANLVETKTKDEILEILKLNGSAQVDTAARKLYTDIDLKDNSKDTFTKTKHLLRFNNFWEYWHILNAHLADEWKENICSNQIPLSEEKITKTLKSYQSDTCYMYKSLLKDMELKDLKQDDVVYIYYTDDVYKEVENWYYNIDGFPVEFTERLVVSTIGELLEKLKK